jgi:hydroxyacylglutathione hydrolase
MAGPGHPVDETLKEGDIVAGFTIFEVRGHSPGHLAFWQEHDGVLVVGDVVFGMRVPSLRPGLQLPPSGLTPDPSQICSPRGGLPRSNRGSLP